MGGPRVAGAGTTPGSGESSRPSERDEGGGVVVEAGCHSAAATIGVPNATGGR